MTHHKDSIIDTHLYLAVDALDFPAKRAVLLETERRGQEHCHCRFHAGKHNRFGACCTAFFRGIPSPDTESVQIIIEYIALFAAMLYNMDRVNCCVILYK